MLPSYIHYISTLTLTLTLTLSALCSIVLIFRQFYNIFSNKTYSYNCESLNEQNAHSSL